MSSNNPRSTGLTLVEVLGALTLIGVLVVSLIVGRAQAQRQHTLSQQHRKAVAVADALLTRWWSDPRNFPYASNGVVNDSVQWTWRTQIVPDEKAEALGARIVRLTIRRTDQADNAPPLVSVDLLMPKEEGDVATND